MKRLRKILKITGLIYLLCLATLSLACLISCRYTLCGYKLATHAMDYHAVVSSEIKRDAHQILLPVYEQNGKYYALAESVVLRKYAPLSIKMDIGDSSQSDSGYEYHHSVAGKAYYELQIEDDQVGKRCIFAPSSLESPLDLHATPAPAFVGFVPVANMVLTCEKDGKTQIFNFAEERFSWRALYAVPAAGVALLAVDAPVFVISCTVYLARESLL